LKQPTGPRYKPPVPPIRIGAADQPDAELRFASLLVWYMRILGLLWMGLGILLWAGILAGQTGDLLGTMGFLGGGAIVFFCVLDLVAAVGLWLTTPWGGVVWLVTVCAQWITLFALPPLFPYDRAVGVIDVMLVAGYCALAYRAAREGELSV
jgi:hypothetical protein